MLRRTSNILNARVDEDLRAKVERYARKHDLNLSQVVLKALEALVDDSEKKHSKPLEQTAQIPNRLLEIERQYGLTAIESVKSLAAFGVKGLEDLTSPDVLIRGITKENLRDFAELYEVNLEWLMTGEGSIYQPTHTGWYVYQIAQRICDCYLADELNQVWFISTHSYPEQDPQTRIRIAIEKLHPITDYAWSHPSNNSFRVYETFPLLSWHGHQKTFLNLVRFCLKLWKATGDIKFYPQGRTFTQRAHDGLEEGWLSFAQACGDTTYAWNPEIEYNHQYDKLFAKRVHDFDEHRDWEMLEKVISETLAKLEFKREADHGSLLAKTYPSEEV